MSGARVRIFLVFSACLLVPGLTTRAQSSAESGSLNSKATMTSGSIKSTPVATPKVTKPTPSQHLAAPIGPPPEDLNRKSFEDKAGQNAGKLLLRSVPTGADVYVNHLPVGQTPLLMIVAPGQYKIEMRGSRQESGHSTVGVLPKDTQTLVLTLNQRYPTTITLH
jgi:hypothetical protein